MTLEHANKDIRREDRYVDCDVCSERFVGDAAIRSYINETEEGRSLCDACFNVHRCDLLCRPR